MVWLLPLLSAWAWLAGASPSMVRSVTMVALLAEALRLRRPANAIDALAAVGLIELANARYRAYAEAGNEWVAEVLYDHLLETPRIQELLDSTNEHQIENN